MSKKEKKPEVPALTKVSQNHKSNNSKEDSAYQSASGSSGQGGVVATSRSGNDSKLSNHTRIRNKVNQVQKQINNRDSQPNATKVT